MAWPSWTPRRARKRSASPWSAPESGTPSWCTRARPSRWCRNDRGADMTKRSRRPDSAAAMESLYPFLYAGDTPDLGAVLAEVRASTVAKAREITELRRVICAQDAKRLTECAQQMAARFTGGGRLLAFGNGGSATDAQQLATLFLDPGPGERALPAFCLANDIAVVTALCNDVGVEGVFARQIAAFGQSRDIAIGLSTSGNSENLLRALDEAAR